MSGAGFSPLLAYDPQDYVKWQQLQRRQALAQALLEKGMGETSNRPYSGLVQAGNSLLGAYLLKRSDADTAAMFGGGGDQTSGPSPDPGQISNIPTPPVKTADAAAGPPQAAPQAQPPSPNQGMPSQPPSQSPAPPQASQGQGSPINPHIAAIYNNPTFPKIPGVDPGTAVMAMMQGGTAWSDYMKAYYAAVGPTDEIKTLHQAGIPQDKINELIRNKAIKDGLLDFTRLGVDVNPSNPAASISVPNNSGVTTVWDPQQNRFVQTADPQSMAAQAAAARASAAGSASVTPAIGYDAQGNPVATNKLQMSGGGGAYGLPGGQNAGPPSGAPTAAPAQPLRPELPPGMGATANQVGGDAGKMWTRTQAAANDANQQMNVIQNVYDLSRHGAATGNLAETRAALDNYAASLGFSPGNVSNRYEEIVKFMAQNTLKNWQAAGGTGTDAQLQNAAAGTIHPEMLPGAVQDIARWNMAIIRLNQAKANAQSNWFASRPLNATNMASFENRWAANADPRLFQFKMMSTPEKQAFVAHMSKPEAAQFLAKMRDLKALGALQ